MKTHKYQAEKLLKIIEEKDRQIAELVSQNQWLIEQFKLLRQGKFGKSKETADSEAEDQMHLLMKRKHL